MIYEIGIFWIIPLIMCPFFLGILTGVKTARQRIMIKLLKKMDLEELQKLLDG
jgi:hypothetical protein